MKKPESIKNKLNSAGYYVGIRELDGIKHLFGGIKEGEKEGCLKLGVEIRVYMEENKIIFYEVIKQTYKRIEFSSDDDVVAFVKKRFPISEE
jgi:hypothetical protein